MISEMEILAVLREVLDARGRLGPEEVRAASILSSLFSGGQVRYDLVVDSILAMGRTGLVAGDLERGVSITPEGRALLSALGEKRIGASRLDSLRVITEPLRRAPSTLAFVRDYAPQVTDLVRAQSSKFVPPEGEVVLCGILLRVEGPPTVYRSVFDLPKKPRDEDATPWRAIHRARERLCENLNIAAHASVEGEQLVITCSKALDSLELESHVLRCRESRTTEREGVSILHVSGVQDFVAEELSSRGYSPVGSVRRVFVRYGERTGAEVDSVPALRVFYQPLDAAHVVLWVEEFTKPWVRAIDLLAGAHTPADMAARLEGQPLRGLPYERPATLVDALPAQDLGREKVPGTGLTFLDYWSDLGYELEERIQPLLVLKTKTGQYSYPAEMVLIRAPPPDLLDAREPFVLSPEERYKGIIELARKLFPTGTAAWRDLRVSVAVVGPTLETLPTTAVLKVARINPPLLRFGGGQVSSDPLDVFSLGPEAGRKNVVIRNVYRPVNADPERCLAALRILCGHYAAIGLGIARLDPDVQAIAYDPGSQRSELGALVRRTVRKGDDDLGIAVLEEGEDAYFAFKRYYPEHAESPLQAIQVETIPRILTRQRGLLDQLALNVYLKRLGRRESAWTLLSPAGGAARTTFAAIAFSRALDPNRAGKGVAVLHDSMGRGLNWNMLVTPGERLITEAWFNTVMEQLEPLLEGEPLDRLVLYRAGPLYPEEGDAIRRSLSARMKAVKANIDFIAVMNEHRRFFVRTKGTLRNPSPGTAIFWSNGDVLMAASGFAERGIHRGTVVPVGLKQVLGSTPMEQVAAEYHDLTHLSWSAPSTTWKHPLVMKIAERLAEVAREGVPASAIRSLPL